MNKSRTRVKPYRVGSIVFDIIQLAWQNYGFNPVHVAPYMRFRAYRRWVSV